MYEFEDGGWMFGGGFMMLLWWLWPIAFGVWLAYYLSKPSAEQSSAQNNALNILKERYARGEIGKDGVEQKKRDLGS